MSQSSCDRHYLNIPAPSTVDERASARATAATKRDDVEGRATFRASLLYVAADLRSIAKKAPSDRVEQLLALSALITSMAER